MDSRSLESGKIIALLDVDATLVSSGDAGYLNQSLLDALKAQGVTDIYLFSTMYRSSLAHDLEAWEKNQNAYTRPNLIEELKRQGFNVPRVCIPADMVKPDVDYVKTLNLTQKELNDLQNKTTVALGTGKLGGVYEHYKQAYDRLTKQAREAKANNLDFNFSDDVKYKEFVQALNTDDGLAGYRGNRAGYGQDPYRDTKGFMYEELLRNISDIETDIGGKVEGIIYCDDAKSCVAAVGRARDLIAAKKATNFPSNLVTAEKAAETEQRVENLPAVPLEVFHVPAFTVRSQEQARAYNAKNAEQYNNTIGKFISGYSHDEQVKKSLAVGKEMFVKTAAAEARLNELTTNIQKLVEGYAALKRTTHQKDIIELQSEVNKILNTKEPAEKKYQNMVKLLESTFGQEMGKYNKPFMGIGQMRSNDDFITRLNQNKNDYHYPRLLAITLQTVYKHGASDTNNRTWRNDYFRYVSKVKLRGEEVYVKQIPSLLELKDQAAFKLWKETALTKPPLIDQQSVEQAKILDKAPQREAQLFRLYQGQDTLDAKAAKNIWPILKKLPDKAIGSWLEDKDFSINSSKAGVPLSLQGIINYQLANLKAKIEEKKEHDKHLGNNNYLKT